jgi:uncharacterized damage-inducible protein DinB
METLQSTSVQTSLFIKMALSAWEIQNERVNKFLAATSDEQLKKEIAPGKNTGIYLLGHLVTVNDGMLPLFGLGEKLFPALENPFLKLPDKSGEIFPSVAELKKCWNEVSAKLADRFASMKSEDWFSRHTAVSAEDFSKEPHRNKLNVLLNRTAHQAYHLGQMILLK